MKHLTHIKIFTMLSVILIIFICLNIMLFVKEYNAINTTLSDNSPESQLIQIINCDNEIMEGDIIPPRIYNPFGEWEAITTQQVKYQLKHGARIIQCK